MFNLKPETVKELIEIPNNNPQEIKLKIFHTDVRTKYMAEIWHSIELFRDAKRILICETLTVFQVDVEREILSKDDFLLKDFEIFVCEGCAHNRLRFLELTIEAPVGLFLALPYDRVPKVVLEAFQDLIRRNKPD